MVTSAADYSQVGGHAAVRGEVVEDVALARRYTALGLPVACLGGRGAIRYRMYPGGLGQLVEGWTKNFATGAGATRPATFALVFLWLSGCIMAPWLLGAAATHGDTAGLLVAALVYATYAGQLAWMLERIGRFGWTTAALYPVPLAFFLAVFARSLVRTHVRRQVIWRGRTIATKPTSTTSAGEEAPR